MSLTSGFIAHFSHTHLLQVLLLEIPMHVKILSGEGKAGREQLSLALIVFLIELPSQSMAINEIYEPV